MVEIQSYFICLFIGVYSVLCYCITYSIIHSSYQYWEYSENKEKYKMYKPFWRFILHFINDRNVTNDYKPEYQITRTKTTITKISYAILWFVSSTILGFAFFFMTLLIFLLPFLIREDIFNLLPDTMGLIATGVTISSIGGLRGFYSKYKEHTKSKSNVI